MSDLPSTFAPTATPVILFGSPSPLCVWIIEVATLVRVEVKVMDWAEQVPDTTPLVILAGQAEPVKSRCPQIRVGQGTGVADVHLPAGAHLLAQILTEATLALDAAAPGETRGAGRRCTVVGAWQGGVGTSTTAQKLAQEAGALLLDASGNPAPPPKESCLHWDLVDPLDPPLPADLLQVLPRVGGLRVLGPQIGLPVAVDDLRVSAVVARSPVPTVVDAGVWTPRIESGIARIAAAGIGLRTILLGNGGSVGALRLAGILGTASSLGLPHLILVADRGFADLGQATRPWGIPLRRRPPLRSREWRSFWAQLWQT